MLKKAESVLTQAGYSDFLFHLGRMEEGLRFFINCADKLELYDEDVKALRTVRNMIEDILED